MNKRFCILLVDDDLVNIRFITTTFKDEYTFLTSQNGHDAINQVREKRPDLILLDIMMPDINGFEICKIIKADERFADIPIIFLTAMDTIEGELQGLEYGGIDYLTKPVNLPLLKLRIRNHLALKDRNDLVKEQRDQLARQKEELSQMLAEIELQKKRQSEVEENYQTLFREMLDGFALHEIICDSQGNPIDYRFLAVNPAFERLTGFKQADIVGRTVLEVLPGTEKHWIKKFGKVSLTGKPAIFEKYASEMNKHFEVSAFQPSPNQFACIFVDITERKQTETYREMGRETLQILSEPGNFKESVQRILKLFKKRTGFDAVGIRLEEGDDHPYFAQTGFTKEFLRKEKTLVKKPVPGGLYHDESGNLRLECTCGLVISDKAAPMHSLFTSGGSFWTNDSLPPLLDRPADAAPRLHPLSECMHQSYASLAFVPIRYKDGIVGLLQFCDRRKGRFTPNMLALLEGMASHIGEAMIRKQAEAALLESENLLRYALEGTNDGLWDVQMKTGKTYLSPRSYEILGYHPAEGAKSASSWADLVHPDDLPLTNERLKAHLEGQSPIFEVEQRLRMKSGDWKWVLSRGKVVTWDADGKPLRITGTHTDLTLQKKLESELHHSQKMESIGRLAGGVAHDFNNMLSVIIGYACLGMMEADSTQPLHSYLTEIHTAAERSAGLTQKLLTFARKQTITPEVQDLNETVAEMFKMLRRLIGENIILKWQPAPDLYHVKVDPIQIDQILVNLCANARDAIADAGTITIKTENCTIDHDYCSHHAGIVPGEYVLLVVSDDGCGMDLETLPHIFEPFFTTKGIAEGTGLGLATVYGAVKLNNGFIYVDSEPGVGTTFSTYLPRYAGNAEQGGESAVESALGGQETIMLVDDEQAILNITTMFLTRQGYKVLPINSPIEAISLAREHEGEISLLITDVIMPEMNGKELANNLQVLYPQLKCLFMSGYTANVIAHHGVLGDGVNFIQKPVSLPELVNKVREILDGW